MEFETFTHGIVVIDSKTLVEDNELEILHFIGFSREITEEDLENIKQEAETVEEFGLTQLHERCLFLKAPKELVEFYNIIIEENGIEFKPDGDLNNLDNFNEEDEENEEGDTLN